MSYEKVKLQHFFEQLQFLLQKIVHEKETWKAIGDSTAGNADEKMKYVQTLARLCSTLQPVTHNVAVMLKNCSAEVEFGKDFIGDHVKVTKG